MKKDSTGSYEYTPKERDLIYEYIGDLQLYKQVERIMKSPRYKKEIEWLRIHRSNNTDLLNERLLLKKKLLPVYQELNSILRNAQKVAEARLVNERPDIADVINKQRYINFEMQKGNVPGAAEIQEQDLEQQQLLQYGGSR